MRGISVLLPAVALVLTMAGCVAPPRLLDPGPERWQQTRAQRFDPYPVTDPGLPSVSGTRPQEYRESPPEVLRVQPRRGEPVFTPGAVVPADPFSQPVAPR